MLWVVAFDQQQGATGTDPDMVVGHRWHGNKDLFPLDAQMVVSVHVVRRMVALAFDLFEGTIILK
jgi:hypothetical protein